MMSLRFTLHPRLKNLRTFDKIFRAYPSGRFVNFCGFCGVPLDGFGRCGVCGRWF